MRALPGAALAAFLSLCVTPASAQGMTGLASYYGSESGTRTASGERFRPNGMTAAMRRVRLGTRVRVTNLRNHRSVTVRVNDRGPFVAGRIIDVSRGAAVVLGMIGAGVVQVRVEVLS